MSIEVYRSVYTPSKMVFSFFFATLSAVAISNKSSINLLWPNIGYMVPGLVLKSHIHIAM